ncbi:O-antigen ligase family protein [Caulobacter segnis]|uniref:O-antigen ligase family protein n=1 Tax=Caulobacter segnis TaxID=88688 RepID=UPI00240F220A|nr:O-antigen ligase family protein [Caulobacter segnis]MDG2520485.1 O-antigen ligase family protein [Caulobacter segnis]
MAVAAASVINLAHWLYGAQRTEMAMGLTLVSGLLVVAVMATREFRQDLIKVRGLIWPVAFFALSVLAVLWSLTPWVPGGPHPAWAYVGERGFASIDPSGTVVELIKLIGIGCLFLIGVALGASDKRAHLALSLTVYAGAAFSAWMFLAYAGGDPTAQYSRRLAGHFLSANTPATLVGMLGVLGLGLAMRRARQAHPSRRIAAVAPAASATLIFMICLICTASRAGMAATAVGAALVLVGEGLRGGGKTRPVTLLLVGLASAAALVAFAGDQLIARLFSVSADADVRGTLNSVHWKAFLASPINGYGLGSFNAINRIYLDAQNFPVLWNVNSTHNVYIQWLEEGGLAAALPMFGAIASVIGLTIFHGLRRERMRGWIVAVLGCSAIILLHGWTDFALQAPSVAGLWALLLGIGFSASQSSRRQPTGRKAHPWLPVAGATAGLSGMVGAVLVLSALGTGAASIGGLTFLRLAVGFDRHADRLLAGGSSAGVLDAARSASQEALKLAPYDTAAWLRLVYIDQVRSGRLERDAVKMFETTYDLVPIDPYVARWRIRFGLEHWGELNPESRAYVQREAEFLLEDPAHQRYVTGDLKSIASPTGRMVAAFWLNPIGRPKR